MKLIVQDQAKDSLKRSLHYLSIYYTVNYINGLKRKVTQELRWLKDHPQGGQFEPELGSSDLGYRRVIDGPFKIIYRVVNDTIIVNDIFDARRDPKDMKG